MAGTQSPDTPGTSPDSDRIAWHPAFLEVIQLELEPYRDILQFIVEHPLTTEPLKIDVLIIKKRSDVTIEKNIARIFRKDNIVEYKSPGDYVSVKDFYKVYSYACLYMATQEGAAITDMTLTFIESHYPRELINHLREVRGYEVERETAGIYRVKGDILPIQIIDSRELSGEENLWLWGLSDRLDAAAFERLVNEVERKGKGAMIEAFMDAVTRANEGMIAEVLKMREVSPVLEQALVESGLAAKWETRGETRGEVVRARKVVRNLLSNGFSVEQAAKLAELDIAEVKSLSQAK